MHDLLISAAFVLMVFAPCIAAMHTGVHYLEEERDFRG